MTDSKREPENTGKIRGSNTKRGGNVLIFVVAAVLALSAGIGFSHFRAQRTARMDSVSRELLPDRDTSSNRFEPSPDTSVATRSPQVTAEEKQRIRKILDHQAGLPNQPVSGSGYVEPLGIDGGAVQMEMVWVPPGTYTMGSDDGHGDEKPAHTVEISHGFWISKYEITQAQYEAVMKRNPSFLQGYNFPVERLSWQDCRDFAHKLSGDTGRNYRLPTEAQWEYACRAGTSGRYCLGNEFDTLPRCAWYQNNAGNRPRLVGLKEPNAWGIHDMHGNVAEWCLDWYHSDYYKTSPGRDPEGPMQPEIIDLRVIRGGAWNMLAPALRSAFRYALSYQYGYRYTGLRLIAEPRRERDENE